MKKVVKATIKAKGKNMTAAEARKYAFSTHSQDFYIDDGENKMLHPSEVDNAFEAIHALHQAGELFYAMLLACKLVDGYRAFFKQMTEWRGEPMRVNENKNRNVVYEVVAGSYSDKFTDGYCTTRELAKKYCALKNAGGTQGYNDYRVEELACLDDTSAQVEKIWFAYEFCFERVSKSWRVTSKRGGDGTPDYTHRPPLVLDNLSRQIQYRPAGVYVTVWVDEPDEEKAKEIAIDAFYRWRAENPDNGVIETEGERRLEGEP